MPVTRIDAMLRLRADSSSVVNDRDKDRDREGDRDLERDGDRDLDTDGRGDDDLDVTDFAS